jgi:hypothetical protein
MHGGAALMRFERVLVIPQGIRPGECMVNKLVWRTPVGDLRRPVDGKKVPAQAITDECSRGEFQGRLKYAEIQPRRSELLQIFRSRKKTENFFQWSRHPLLPFQIIRPHTAMERQRPRSDSNIEGFESTLHSDRRNTAFPALTGILNSGKTNQVMSRWNASTSTLILLGSAVFVVLLLVVLPDVDPPDTAFHRETAPVVLHAQANASPPLMLVAPVLPRVAAAQYDWVSLRLSKTAVLLPPHDRTIQLCSIRC